MRIFIFCAAILFSLASIAQDSFILTADGFVSSADNTKKFIVLDFPGIKKEELFKKMELYVNKTNLSWKDAGSKVEPESISATGHEKNAIRRNAGDIFNMDYTVTYEFKDGRIRINAPNFALTSFNDKTRSLKLVANTDLGGNVFGIYNKSGKLKSDRAKRELEKFFNNYITTTKADLSKTNADW